MDSKLSYIINHVFLPPRLPLKDDSDASNDAALVEQLLNGLERLQDHIPKWEQPTWSPLIKMTRNVLLLRDCHGDLSKGCSGQALEQMTDGGRKWPVGWEGKRKSLLNLADSGRCLGISHPRAECGISGSKASRSVYVRVVRNLSGHHGRGHDEGPLTTLLPWPCYCY